MKTNMRFIAVALLAIASSFAMSSCSDDDDKKDAADYTLQFASENDANIEVDAVTLSDTAVHIVTNAPAEALKLEKVNAQTWCSATIKSADRITITSGTNPENTDREAKYKLTAGSASLEFTIVQVGKNPENCTLSIESNALGNDPYVGYTYTDMNQGAVLSVKINTTAQRWKAETSTMASDDEWIVLKKTSGKTGTNLEATFLPNATGMMRNGTIKISGGDAESITIVVMQTSLGDATSYKLYSDVAKTKEIANGTALSFNASDIRVNGVTYYVKTDGGFFIMYCTPGTENETAADWLDATGNTEVLRIQPKNANTTNQSRSVDVVIYSNDWETELFRIPVTQKGN